MSPKIIIRSNQDEQQPRLTGQVQGTTKQVLQRTGQKVDIVQVVDTTGSMDDKIEALLRTCSQLVDESNALNLDPNFAVISFGDISVKGGGDQIRVEVSLTDDVNKVKTGLRNIHHNNGFGNGGESSLEAIEKALQLRYRDGAIRVIILITDDYAHQYRLRAAELITRLKKEEFLVFVLSIPAVYYKEMAVQNGGTWSEISAGSSLEDLLKLFRKMAETIAQTSKQVFLQAGGSVIKYLKLNPPKNS